MNGALYGTATLGGGAGCFAALGCGVVFEVSTTGIERVVYRFAGGMDGWNPQANLLAVNGALFGTTEYGGPSGNGTIFEIAP
jgi:uncharacterized repeat protein (TIGR03803 family)